MTVDLCCRPSLQPFGCSLPTREPRAPPGAGLLFIDHIGWFRRFLLCPAIVLTVAFVARQLGTQLQPLPTV